MKHNKKHDEMTNKTKKIFRHPICKLLVLFQQDAPTERD